jgi:hypothetical protein
LFTVQRASQIGGLFIVTLWQIEEHGNLK